MPIEIVCDICGTKKLYPPSAVKRGGGKHCSRECYYKSHAGKETWNKGLKGWRTPEHSQNLRKAIIQRNKQCRIHPEQAKKNGMKAIPPSGEKHYRWRGGITPENRKIRNSIKYEQWRTQVFQRDNYTCQKCFKQGSYLQAHHIKPFSVLLEEALHCLPLLEAYDAALQYLPLWEVANGKTLCEKCHKKKHKKI
jgi:5-methylcytosine-specific restriction endonuclease McrA